MKRPRATSQLRLDLAGPPSHRRVDFVISPSNDEAVTAIDAWPNWLSGALALVGPESAGKTHLARSWAHRAGAVEIKGRFDPEVVGSRPVLLEDADAFDDADGLFHLLNLAAAGRGLLLTSRLRPSAWTSKLPDLRSRLNALRVVELAEPDDALLEGLLLKLFRERHIRPTEDVTPYLLRRMERSAPAAKALVDLIDEQASAEGRAISRAFVRQILEIEAETPDLFE